LKDPPPCANAGLARPAARPAAKNTDFIVIYSLLP
jgi:hypothetical protein